MKILILANNDVGLYRFRKELVFELLKNNEVFLSLPYGENVKFFQEKGCDFIGTKISRHGKNPFVDLKLMFFYKKIIKKIKPDVVLTYTIKPNIYGGIACQRQNIPYIVNVTGLGNAIENGGFVSKITLFLYKKGIKKANTVFFQNKANQYLFKEKNILNPISNSMIIPGSGINLIENPYEKYPEDNGKISFVTIGRILKDKGIDELLYAASAIRKKYDNVTFTLVGPLEDDYEKKIKNAVDLNIINFLGQRNDIHDIIKQSNATVHPSYHEGMSNVLLETAACGRPILASLVPGCKETFDDGFSGIGFKPKNEESLLDAIESFINLPHDKKIEMGLNGRHKMEKEFDRNIIISLYINLINKIYNNK